MTLHFFGFASLAFTLALASACGIDRSSRRSAGAEERPVPVSVSVDGTSLGLTETTESISWALDCVERGSSRRIEGSTGGGSQVLQRPFACSQLSVAWQGHNLAIPASVAGFAARPQSGGWYGLNDLRYALVEDVGATSASYDAASPMRFRVILSQRSEGCSKGEPCSNTVDYVINPGAPVSLGVSLELAAVPGAPSLSSSVTSVSAETAKIRLALTCGTDTDSIVIDDLETSCIGGRSVDVILPHYGSTSVDVCARNVEENGAEHMRCFEIVLYSNPTIAPSLQDTPAPGSDRGQR